MSFPLIPNNINPKKLFLIDSIGALLSAILLGLVLARFENIFGMPPKTLYALSFIACIFSIYSFLCFSGKIENWRPYLKIIAIANLLYCLLTIGLIIYFYQKLTVLGLIYFVLEIIIITILAMIELKTAANLNYKKA
jgi:hypothetical protein